MAFFWWLRYVRKTTRLPLRDHDVHLAHQIIQTSLWTYGHGQVMAPILRTHGIGTLFYPPPPPRPSLVRILFRNASPRQPPRHPNPLHLMILFPQSGPVRIPFLKIPIGPDIITIRRGLSRGLATAGPEEGLLVL